MSKKLEQGGLASLLTEQKAREARAGETLPSIEELCVRSPLYHSVETKNKEFLRNLRQLNIQFDAYCISCNKDSTFKTGRSYGGGAGQPVDADWMLKPGYVDVEVTCQRHANHKYLFVFHYDGSRLVKYGQLPSLEDVSGADIRKYAPFLRDGYFGELKRATGLASHGIGIGSFVYLRRIFEKLIQDHHADVRRQGKEVKGFAGLRIEEKIEALKSVLPEALVRNRAAYGILSIGIHELDEDTCRRYFPVVRAAIINILEQDFQKRQSEQTAADLENEISRISGDLKRNKRAAE